jgi:hypothetical protein
MESQVGYERGYISMEDAIKLLLLSEKTAAVIAATVDHASQLTTNNDEV